jgi:potassium/chloride transporter 4/5/6
VINANKMAALIPKGIAFYPDSGDRISGNIDIWWIIHDGGLLMLLPFLLKQHRTWRNCKLRIFTIAQIEDNSIQMKNDLVAFLYALRIDCEVEVVEMMNSDISAYTYERTLMMEQRNQILKELNLTKRRRKSMVDEVINPALPPEPSGADDTTQLIGEGSAVQITQSKVRFQVQQYEEQIQQANGTADFDPTQPKLQSQSTLEEESEEEEESGGTESDNPPPLAATQPPEPINVSKTSLNSEGTSAEKSGGVKPDEENVRRMHTAVKLNEVILHKSVDSKLVIINLPSPPKRSTLESDSNYMEFLEVLTEGMDRVLMVRGSGREVKKIRRCTQDFHRACKTTSIDRFDRASSCSFGERFRNSGS